MTVRRGIVAITVLVRLLNGFAVEVVVPGTRIAKYRVEAKVGGGGTARSYSVRTTNGLTVQRHGRSRFFAARCLF
jgi:hypothetical protein